MIVRKCKDCNKEAEDKDIFCSQCDWEIDDDEFISQLKENHAELIRVAGDKLILIRDGKLKTIDFEKIKSVSIIRSMAGPQKGNINSVLFISKKNKQFSLANDFPGLDKALTIICQEFPDKYSDFGCHDIFSGKPIPPEKVKSRQMWLMVFMVVAVALEVAFMFLTK